ncbi:MAG TPA: preprotein translocase subunit YajC [Candidatus Syntrophosphaera sp.]|nr:preprotein translocase subunit YajC [Candidatus Syntrophosphaera sp.]
MLYILLQTTAPTASGTRGGGIGAFLPIIVMFALLYFLMIMPQQKKQKQLQKMLEALQVNDKVVTTSGIHGRIVNFKPEKNTVVIEIDETNKVRVEFARSAIAGLVSQPIEPQS